MSSRRELEAPRSAPRPRLASSPAGISSQRDPPGSEARGAQQGDNYPTIADRLLAIRAQQESQADGRNQTLVVPVASTNSVNSTRRNSWTSPSSTRQTLIVPPTSNASSRRNSWTDNSQSPRSPRQPLSRHPSSTRRAATRHSHSKKPRSHRPIQIFTGLLFLIGIPLLITGITLISLPDKPQTYHDTGLVLIILASVMTAAATLMFVLLCLGVCAKKDHTIIQVQRANMTQITSTSTSGSAPGPDGESEIYHPQPAPGYHTPLPYGPTLPGYIPPQVVFSEYAKKAFNHRAVLSGTDTPLAEAAEQEDMPPGFHAYAMKSPREASSDHDLVSSTFGEGSSPRQGHSRHGSQR